MRKQLVIRGPTNAAEFDWWKIDYDSEVDGWTVEDNLQKVITLPPTAPAPSRTDIKDRIARANFQPASFMVRGKCPYRMRASGLALTGRMSKYSSRSWRDQEGIRCEKSRTEAQLAQGRKQWQVMGSGENAG